MSIFSTVPVILSPYSQKEGSAVLFSDWNEFETWLKDFDDVAVKERFATTLKDTPHTTMITIKLFKEDMAELRHKLYYKENKQYVVEIRTRIVPANTLPSWARDKMTSSEEVEITEEVEQELDITL